MGKLTYKDTEIYILPPMPTTYPTKNMRRHIFYNSRHKPYVRRPLPSARPRESGYLLASSVEARTGIAFGCSYPRPRFQAPESLLRYYLSVMHRLCGGRIWRRLPSGCWTLKYLEQVCKSCDGGIEIVVDDGRIKETIILSPDNVGDMADRHGIAFDREDLQDESLVAGWTLPSGALLDLGADRMSVASFPGTRFGKQAATSHHLGPHEEPNILAFPAGAVAGDFVSGCQNR